MTYPNLPIITTTPVVEPLECNPEYRLIDSPVGPQLFVVDGSRLYGIDAPMDESLRVSFQEPTSIQAILRDLLPPRTNRAIGTNSIVPPPLHSLSLNVAQACNMSCSYCYADEGRFGGEPRLMTESIAFRSIDRLFAEAESDATVVLGFMGGEPMLHRELVHRATKYAAEQANGRTVRFSITTNATLLTEEDIALFRNFPYTVQVSIDGDRDANDLARPLLGGGSSYDRILAGLDLFAQHGRPRQLSARVTVTPLTRNLKTILDHLLSLGFDDVGFAPVLVSPQPQTVFKAADFEYFLTEMITCGRRALSEIGAGYSYPFSNFTTALDEIHRGTHRPYPCGAGAAYLSVNAEGELFACHRLIDDPDFAMGHVDGGLDHLARQKHLTRQHVDSMEPCRGCWARYLCGGGCYHEVARRGRPGCDYIRGWIEFCLGAYAELSTTTELFASKE